jgi:glycosyltransferase involved in cell wall biosynthesis
LGFEVHLIGPLNNKLRYVYILKKIILSLFQIKFDIDRPIKVSENFSHQVQKKILNYKYNLIFTTDASIISYLKTKIPIIIWHDMDFLTYFFNYFKKKKKSLKNLHEGFICEKNSYYNAKKIILTSYWAKNLAIKRYKLKKNKIEVLEFGANLISIPKRSKIINNINKKSHAEICNLISVGIDWERKGMDKAVQLVRIMNSKGLKTHLNIIGPKCPKNILYDQNINIVGFLDKRKIADREIMTQYLLDAHFHILFSQSEGCGIVFAEASAFGLYSVSHNIGGIKQMIINNKNGFCFEQNDKLDLIANYLIKIFRNRKEYFLKSCNSRIEFERRLNWNSIGVKLKKIIINNL